MSKSPLLQSRLNAMEKEKGPQAPVVNVILPANFGIPPAPVATPPAPAVKGTGLIPPTYGEGPRMEIDLFCAVYELPPPVLKNFQENAITGTHAFSHISEADLTGMGFKIGEIIDLKEAVKSWAASSKDSDYC